jgi:hypothetical protein
MSYINVFWLTGQNEKEGMNESLLVQDNQLELWVVSRYWVFFQWWRGFELLNMKRQTWLNICKLKMVSELYKLDQCTVQTSEC